MPRKGYFYIGDSVQVTPEYAESAPRAHAGRMIVTGKFKKSIPTCKARSDGKSGHWQVFTFIQTDWSGKDEYVSNNIFMANELIHIE